MKISFYLTNKCNLDRGICYDILKCSPAGQSDIFDRVPAWLLVAKKLGFDEVAFSSGEVTLDFDKLLSVIQKAKELGFTVQVKTNGWWSIYGTDYPQRMYAAGLDQLRISYDSKRFYPDSPLTQEIVIKAIRIGYEVFKSRKITVVPHQGEPDLYWLNRLFETYPFLDLEIQPVLETNFRVKDSVVTGIDSETGETKTIRLPYRGFHPTIDFKGRFFLNSEGIAEAENSGTFTNRYVGDLNSDILSDLFLKYQTLIK